MSAAQVEQPRADLIECARCTEQLPFDANFCLRCGQPQRPEAAAYAADDLESCEIVWWKGYVKGGFYAVPRGSVAADAELPSSRLFRAFRTSRPAEADDAAAAHGELVAQLLADGWTIAGRGAAWWSLRLERGEHGAIAAPSAIPVVERLVEAPATPPVKPPPPPPPPPTRPRHLVTRASPVLAKT